MNIRAGLVLSAFVFGFSVLPAHAQGSGGPPPNYQQLAGQVATLQAQVATLQGQVAKLQGNITAADLVGTYNIVDFQLKLLAGAPPSITHEVNQGTLTLNADGSTSLTVTGNGHRLTLGSPLFVLNESGTISLGPWTYDNGTLSIQGGFSAAVAAGGRVLIVGASALTSAGGSDEIAILTRLQ
jgi:outer membrane murein-binding lipoprotein Lpp